MKNAMIKCTSALLNQCKTIGSYIFVLKKRLFYQKKLSTLFFRDNCVGSKILCEFAIDKSDKFLESNLKNITWPKLYDGDSGTIYKRIRTLSNNMIIVKLKFETPTVEMTVLDSRTTLSDKIAKLGGTYGLWVQLTGCALLVLINVFVVAIKMGFRMCRQKTI